MIIKAEVIVEGPSMIMSTLKVIDKPVSFLGMVNPKTGILKAEDNHVEITGVILSFPYMIGSTVAPYIIYSLKRNKKAPVAMICSSVDALLASGCAISDIPLLTVTQSDFELLKKYRERTIKVNAKSGEILIDEQ